MEGIPTLQDLEELQGIQQQVGRELMGCRGSQLSALALKPRKSAPSGCELIMPRCLTVVAIPTWQELEELEEFNKQEEN